MNAKLYVGNLSFDTTEEDLQTLFAGAGTVAAVTLIKDRETGRSKGFAFVEMSSQSEAENAIKMFNNATLGNRNLKVDKARPPEERTSGGYGGGGGYGGRSGGYGGGGGSGGSRDRRGGKGGPRRY